MARLRKCCFCCSLKYGNLCYGVICLMLRICTITTLIVVSNILLSSANDREMRRSFFYLHGLVVVSTSVLGYLAGWFVASSGALFFALMGIVHKRSILLFPYIVVLALEIIKMTIISIIAAVGSDLYFLIVIPIIMITDVYPLICLISLYKEMKEKERIHSQVPYPDVQFKII